MNNSMTEDSRLTGKMLTIKVAAETALTPQRVLDAAHDFADRRAEVWPNVRAKHLMVQARGENYAEVTEGTWVVGLFWERNRYEWSQPGSVKATVLDSNIFRTAAKLPGSRPSRQPTRMVGETCSRPVPGAGCVHREVAKKRRGTAPHLTSRAPLS